jgi:hypothetical protein
LTRPFVFKIIIVTNSKGGDMSKTYLSMKLVSVILCVALLALPIICQQQEAVNQARLDAERNVSGSTYLFLGIFLGLLGYVIALLSPPSAPASALIGKSPDYVAVYTDTYREVGKKRQMSKALLGCLIGTGIQVGLIVLLVVVADSSTPSYY